MCLKWEQKLIIFIQSYDNCQEEEHEITSDVYHLLCLFENASVRGPCGNAASEPANTNHLQEPPCCFSGELFLESLLRKPCGFLGWGSQDFPLQLRAPSDGLTKDFSLLMSRKVNFNEGFHSPVEDLSMPKDLQSGCLLIRKCDTELLNKFCDSLHPAWAAARRGCIITSNLVRNCSLVRAGWKGAEGGAQLLSLPETCLLLSNFPSSPPVCDGSWSLSSLKLRTKNPLKN